MQTSFLHPLTLPLCPFSGNFSSPKIRIHKRNRPSNSVFASKRDAFDNNRNGRLVDGNMVVLRKRIHEMKMEEINDEPPQEWMEWEKRYYSDNCNDDITEAIGFLQYVLMETRPSLALGMVALVLFCVPTSMVAVGLWLMDMAKGIHLN